MNRILAVEKVDSEDDDKSITPIPVHLLSGFICGLLNYLFCIVFSIIIFEGKENIFLYFHFLFF